MNGTHRHRLDLIQNITIVLLSVSMVLLLTQTQLYHLGAAMSGEYLSFFQGRVSQSSSVISAQETPLTAPVHVALTGPYGRSGSVTLTTADETFAPLRSLLEQTLRADKTYTASSSQAFLTALGSTSVYYDFLTSLPLPILANLMWTSAEETNITARQLLLSLQNEQVFLYLRDTDDRYLCCETDLSPETLSTTINQYELENAQFAFDTQESYYQTLSPYSLFLETEPTLFTLSGIIPKPHTDDLLRVLGFNPNTQNRYPDSQGNEVIMEPGGTLRIRTDGTVVYQSSTDSAAALSIQSMGDIPTSLEAVIEISTLLRQALLPTLGSANLWLENIQHNGRDTTLRFGYQVGGIPLRFPDGQSAAEVTLSGTTVSSLTLRLRQYTITDANSLLLPLRQALAIAAVHAGSELTIGYIDNGSGTISVQWLAN